MWVYKAPAKDIHILMMYAHRRVQCSVFAGLNCCNKKLKTFKGANTTRIENLIQLSGLHYQAPISPKTQQNAAGEGFLTCLSASIKLTLRIPMYKADSISGLEYIVSRSELFPRRKSTKYVHVYTCTCMHIVDPLRGWCI